MLSNEAAASVAPEDSLTNDRRPLKTRSWKVFQRLAAWLAESGVSPNAISVSSILFAAVGACGFVLTANLDSTWSVRLAWLLAAVGMQLRLIANLLDGMVAVEGGRASATGPLYNEVPDRISDPILLVAAGYAIASSPTAGWAAAAAALLVAYVRAIAASVGVGQLFLGPMAKPQRMAVLTAVAIAGFIVPQKWLVWNVFDRQIGLPEVALWIIALGCIATVIRRLRAAGQFLRAQSVDLQAQSENA